MNTNALTDIQKLLQSQLIICEQLNESLEEERSALIENNFDHLQDLTKTKNKSLDQLSKHHQQFEELCRDHLGMVNPEKEFKIWVSKQNQNELAQSWTSLEQQLNAMESQNHINGKLLQRASHRHQFIKNLLMANESNSYSSQGKENSGRTSYTLGKA